MSREREDPRSWRGQASRVPAFGAVLRPTTSGRPRSRAGQRSSGLGVAFLLWLGRNPLKSPESYEEIQENPSLFSWSRLVSLGLTWVRLGGIWPGMGP